MSNQPNMIPSTMPLQVVPAMPPGSTSPMSAGIKLQQQQTNEHMALIGQGKNGGSKRRRLRGGAEGPPVVQVPAVPTGTVNSQATGGNYKELTALSQQQASQSVYDTARTPGQTAGIAAQQQALYSGKTGGSKRGGSWPVWGCLSGGKKSKRRKMSYKCKHKQRKHIKNKKTKKRRQ